MEDIIHEWMDDAAFPIMFALIGQVLQNPSTTPVMGLLLVFLLVIGGGINVIKFMCFGLLASPSSCNIN